VCVQARQKLTSAGFPKMDLVAFTYHHALLPLVDKNALRKELQIHQWLYPQVRLESSTTMASAATANN